LTNLLEKNTAIIFNECNAFAIQNCLNITPTGQPIIITGNGLFVVTGTAPNPVIPILNPRFGAISDMNSNIQRAVSKSKTIFKTKTEKKMTTSGNGNQTKAGQISGIINKIKRTKQGISESNQGDLKTEYINNLISTTVKSILQKKLITPIKLPQGILNLFAQQIAQKTIIGENNYGYYDLNLLIIQTILKTINF
jgi:hypothetical protein